MISGWVALKKSKTKLRNKETKQFPVVASSTPQLHHFRPSVIVFGLTNEITVELQILTTANFDEFVLK